MTKFHRVPKDYFLNLSNCLQVMRVTGAEAGLLFLFCFIDFVESYMLEFLAQFLVIIYTSKYLFVTFDKLLPVQTCANINYLSLVDQ